MRRPVFLSSFRLALGAAAAVLATPVAAATLFLGSYPDSLLVFDERRGAVTGKVKLESGLPTSMQLSPDGKLIYVTTITTSGIEVIDTATRQVVKSVSLNRGNTKYRFSGGVPDPTGRYFYTMLTRIDKGLDRYTVGDLQYAVIDLEEQRVVRTADVEEKDERLGGGRGAFKMSSDGKYLYVFGRKILVVDTEELKVVDRIDLAKPEGTALENAGLGGTLDTIEVAGEHAALFNASDPYIHNKVFGIARFDLDTRRFDFTPIGPAPEAMAGLQVTPDGKTAYTVATTGKYGNKRCEFWRFDLADNRVLDKAEFECRSRFRFGLSGDGRKLYIYGASYDIEVYDARTLKYERTWDLAHDTTGAGMVMVR